MHVRAGLFPPRFLVFTSRPYDWIHTFLFGLRLIQQCMSSCSGLCFSLVISTVGLAFAFSSMCILWKFLDVIWWVSLIINFIMDHLVLSRYFWLLQFARIFHYAVYGSGGVGYSLKVTWNIPHLEQGSPSRSMAFWHFLDFLGTLDYNEEYCKLWTLVERIQTVHT